VRVKKAKEKRNTLSALEPYLLWCVRLVLWSPLYKTLFNGERSLEGMPVNRMLTWWCGFEQRQSDRSAIENTATGGTVETEMAQDAGGYKKWLSTKRSTTFSPPNTSLALI